MGEDVDGVSVGSEEAEAGVAALQLLLDFLDTASDELLGAG